MVIKEKTTSHIYTKDYYERVKQLIETYNLNPKISLSKRLYLYKKILFQVSLFDSVNKDRTTYGKGYFNLKILSKENRKTFGTIKINKQKYEVISVLRDELIEIGLISLISKSNSLFHKSALYQINPDFYTSLVPKKEDVLNLLIDIRGLRFSDTGKLIKTTDTDIVTDSFTVYEEETQLSDREATVMGSLRQLKFDFGTEFQETVSNWIPTASLPQISSCMGNIGRLENGDLYAHDGKKSERIYHNYCNINSELREFIGMKDKTSGELHRMKAIDMKSCQAYLLQKAISDASGDYKSLIDGSPEHEDIYMFLLHHLPDTPTGSFVDRSLISNRKEMKQDFYKFLNCSNSKNEHYTATDYILQKHKPQVYQELRELKDRLKAVGKTMASELQNLEAKLFYSAYSDERIINHCIILHDSLHYADIKGMKELVLQVLWEKIKLLGYPENARFNFE